MRSKRARSRKCVLSPLRPQKETMWRLPPACRLGKWSSWKVRTRFKMARASMYKRLTHPTQPVDGGEAEAGVAAAKGMHHEYFQALHPSSGSNVAAHGRRDSGGSCRIPAVARVGAASGRL